MVKERFSATPQTSSSLWAPKSCSKLPRSCPAAKSTRSRGRWAWWSRARRITSRLIKKQPAKTAKAVLYAYRVLLTGIRLLRTGQIEANLLRLNEDVKSSLIDDLIAMKTEEKVAPTGLDWPVHAVRLDELEKALDRAFDESTLPEDRDRQAVNDFLVQLRLGSDA